MIIGITGKKRSGKDTIGEYLENVHGFKRLSFAKPLKDVVNKYLGVKSYSELDREEEQTFRMWNTGVFSAGEELGLDKSKLLMRTLEVFEPFATNHTDNYTIYRMSYRQVLQLFGTDVCRSLQDDIWIAKTLRKIDCDKNYVITDVRFDNEATALKQVGARIVQVVRNGFIGDSHVSEKGVSESLVDKTIDNTAFEDLYSQVSGLVDA